VKVYNKHGMAQKNGTGMFPREVMHRFPLLPLEEEGRLVADAGKRDWDKLAAEYGAMLMEGLGVMGTRGKHVNVLQHLMGYLKNHLSSEDKQELLGLVFVN
jgi:uncharacterized protein YbgA (DUF1722 family)